MDFTFPVSTLNLTADSWVNLMNDPFTIYYNRQFQELKNFADDQKPSTGFKKLSVNQIVDINIHFRSLYTPKQEKAIGVDLAYLGFVQQASYEGIIGKIHAFFAKIFNWIVRGCFVTSAERCKVLAQDLLGLTSILDNKASKKEFIGAIKAYKKIYEFKYDPETCLLNECLGRWLVSKKSLNHVIKKVYQHEEAIGG